MNKLLLTLPMVAVLAACGTTDPYQKRADNERERQEKYVERSLDKAPKWMTELPKSTAAVYSNGTAVSADMSMADEKAKVIAFGKLCMSAGGEVDKQSRVFRNDIGDSSNENSEMAIRSMCRKVDMTGAEVVETRRITEGTRYRTYVLVAMPFGEANQLKKQKVETEMRRESGRRSTEAFRELDAVTSQPVR